jgi:hypothetical protein
MISLYQLEATMATGARKGPWMLAAGLCCTGEW